MYIFYMYCLPYETNPFDTNLTLIIIKCNGLIEDDALIEDIDTVKSINKSMIIRVSFYNFFL